MKYLIRLYKMLKPNLIASLTFSLLLSLNLNGQSNNKGVFATLGLGVGYSSFGEHYYETRPGSFGVNITEFSGFRSVIFNSRIGYQFTNKISLSSKYVFIPSTSTVLPVSTNWLGANVTLVLPNSDEHYFLLGAGKSKYTTHRGIQINDTILYNIGFGIIIGKAIFEIEIYTGKMKDENSLEPNPFEDTTFEMMPSLSFSYLFSTGKEFSEDF